MKMRNMQVTLIALALIMALLTGVFTYQHAHQDKFDPSQLHGTFVPPGRAVLGFDLLTTQEKSFKPSDLLGKWTILFFGYTQCRSICPISMDALHKMHQILKSGGSLNQLPQVYMISLDPKRDTLQSMSNYVHGFDSDFIGVLGSDEMIQGLSSNLGIVYDAQNQKDGQIDHSGTVTVINPAGEVAMFFTPPLNPQWMAEDLVQLIHHYQQSLI
jgi:protein SCO1/2